MRRTSYKMVLAGHAAPAWHAWIMRCYKNKDAKLPFGAVHIWAQMVMKDTTAQSLFDNPFYGGIELHFSHKTNDWHSDEPSQSHCEFLGGPCWHEGSSLQFSENIAPILAGALSKEDGFNFDPHSLLGLWGFMEGELASYADQYFPDEDNPKVEPEFL